MEPDHGSKKQSNQNIYLAKHNGEIYTNDSLKVSGTYMAVKLRC